MLLFNVITLYFIGINSILTLTEAVNPVKFLIHGPGINNLNTLPTQYFFIQAQDKAGKNITKPLDEKYEIKFVGKSSLGECRVRFEQIDRGDGSVIVRYRPVTTCWDTQIHILYKEEKVGKSPYFLGRIYPENCNCPVNVEDYLKAGGYDEVDEQITKDLNAFSNLNYTKVREYLRNRFENEKASSIAICQYLIKGNKIYRSCFGQHVGFKMFMDAILLSLTRKVNMPDFEIFVNLGDWPVMKKGGQSRTQGPKPVFSWCGSEDSYDIIMPTYDITESSIENMNRVTIDMLFVQKSRTVWEEKISKGFWRGRDARRERLNLIDIARRNPDLINASLTNFFFFRDEEAKYGPKESHISFFKFFDYKYQINIDGTVAAYRLPYLLAGDSVVLKQESPFYEHFYKKLRPYEHYIPFKRDLSDLVDKIKWAMENEEEVEKIRIKSRLFVNDHLLPLNIYCYHMQLFLEWSKLQRGHDLSVMPGMELVTEENGNTQDCFCDRINSKEHHDEL